MRDARCQWCRRALRERRRAERQYARVARGTQGDETPLCSRLRFGRAESPHTFSSTSTSCKSRREVARRRAREEVRCQDGASQSDSLATGYEWGGVGCKGTRSHVCCLGPVGGLRSAKHERLGTRWCTVHGAGRPKSHAFHHSDPFLVRPRRSMEALNSTKDAYLRCALAVTLARRRPEPGARQPVLAHHAFTVPPRAHPSTGGAGLQDGAFLRFTIRRGAVRHVVGRFHIFGHRVCGPL